MVAVLGSGGHTAEMVALLRNLDPTRYTHRTYLISSGDNFSADKAKNDIETHIQSIHKQSFASKAGERDSVTGRWDVIELPRARKIHQSLWSTVFTSLECLRCCITTLRQISQSSVAAPGEYPDVIVTNGPATAVMVIIASLILKLFGIAPLYKMKVIYVESWARVKTLSLSGQILLSMGVCDRFIVQWEGLAKVINGDTTSMSGRALQRLGMSDVFVGYWEKLVRSTFGNEPRREVEWHGFLV